MRIVYVTDSLPAALSSVSLTAARVLNHLRANGHKVQHLHPQQRASDAWPAARALRQQWRQLEPQIVHVATAGPLAWAALRAARAEGISTSADFRPHFHAVGPQGPRGWTAPLWRAWLRHRYALADGVFVPTPAVAEQLRAQGFERLHVAGRGVDAQAFSPRWRDPWLRRAWHANGRDPVLLYVGRLDAEKNLALALDTFEHLREETPGLRMVVVGDGALRHRMALPHPRVRFVGAQRDTELARHCASADVLLYPGLTHMVGNAVLEGMASGLAVVAFDTGLAAQHIHSGRNGWLAPCGDQPAFMLAARRALQQAAPDSALRLAARESALQAPWDAELRAFEHGLRLVAGQAAACPMKAAAHGLSHGPRTPASAQAAGQRGAAA